MSDFFRGRQTSESKREVDVANQQIFIRGSPPAPPGREEEERKNGHTFNVSFEQRFYFGRGHSIPTGSPVRVRFRDRPALALVWGMEKREPVKRQVKKVERLSILHSKIVFGYTLYKKRKRKEKAHVHQRTELKLYLSNY